MSVRLTQKWSHRDHGTLPAQSAMARVRYEGRFPLVSRPAVPFAILSIDGAYALPDGSTLNNIHIMRSSFVKVVTSLCPLQAPDFERSLRLGAEPPQPKMEVQMPNRTTRPAYKSQICTPSDFHQTLASRCSSVQDDLLYLWPVSSGRILYPTRLLG